MSTITAEIVNVTHVYGDKNNYLNAFIIMAQHSSCSILFFDGHRKLLYFNNRIGSFDDASRFDMQNVDSVCSYLDSVYLHGGTIIRDNLCKCYNDMAPRECCCEKMCGDKVKVKLIPVVEDHTLTGVIVFTKLIGWGCNRTTKRAISL